MTSDEDLKKILQHNQAREPLINYQQIFGDNNRIIINKNKELEIENKFLKEKIEDLQNMLKIQQEHIKTLEKTINLIQNIKL